MLVPAYQEVATIGDIVRRIHAVVPDVVVVDDGSTDGTAAAARAAGAHVLCHPVNLGKGAALTSGFHYVREQGFECVICLDGDGQHDPDDISRFIAAYVRTGIPVLVGNRMGDAAAMPLVRRWTNRFMSWLLSRSMGQYVPDTQCGFRLYRCDVLPFVETLDPRFAAESEVLLHVADRGIRMGAVPLGVIYGDQKSRVSPILDTWRFFVMLLRHRRHRHWRPPNW